MNRKSYFDDRVDTTGDCWVWTGSQLPSGYGLAKVKINGKWHTVYAHRFAWERERGPIPKGMFVLHRCDNPSCVNPKHLFLGTARDNSRDMVAKGRHRPFCAAREGNPNAKLTASEIEEIRAAVARGNRQVDVAEVFGVVQSHVSRIVRREQW